MNKREFLQKLREYLSYELPERYVDKNIDYYSDYIDNEVRSGRSVREVLEDLGDPQLIARTITDAAKAGSDGIPNTTDDRDFTEEIYNEEMPFRRSYVKDREDEAEGSSRGRVFDENGADSGYDDRTAGTGSGNEGNHFGGIHVYTGNGCLTGILIVLIIFFLVSLIGSVIGLLSPVLVPVCVVLFILWLLGKRR